MKTYKGMDKDMKCHGGFQYEPGKEYETDKADACHCGFHACEIPLDVFHYFPPNNSRYFEVEQDGEISRHNEDSKIASTKIKIGAEIGIPGIVKAQVEWIKNQIKTEKIESSHDGRSAATNTGDWSAATNTGSWSAAIVSGKDSVAIATGYQSKAKGSLGCAIAVVERGDWDGETYPILSICAAIVDGEKIKADTWYTVKDGKFVEVEDES